MTSDLDPTQAFSGNFNEDDPNEAATQALDIDDAPTQPLTQDLDGNEHMDEQYAATQAFTQNIGDDDNKGLRIWVLHHLVLTVCSLFVQHKLSSQKGRRHLERFSRKYIELCPIIVTEQRCRTPDLA